jgi:hypothetical protein
MEASANARGVPESKTLMTTSMSMRGMEVSVSSPVCILLALILCWGVLRRRRLRHARDEPDTRRQRNRRRLKARLDQVRRMPLVRVAEGDCAVCLEPLSSTQSVRRLTCSHLFHKRCVDKWLVRRGTCPLCVDQVVDMV